MSLFSEHLPDQELNSELDTLTGYIIRYLQENHVQDFVSFVHIVLAKGIDPNAEKEKMMAKLPDMPGLKADRVRLFEQIGKQILEQDLGYPLAVFITAEAWSYGSKDTTGTPLPSLDPKREEVIMTSGARADGVICQNVITISRSPENFMIPGESTTTYCAEGTPNNLVDHLSASFFRGFSFALGEKQMRTNPTALGDNDSQI